MPQLGLCVQPLSMLRFGMIWTYTGFVHAVMTAVSSYVQLPCSVHKKIFPSSHSLSQALILLPSFG